VSHIEGLNLPLAVVEAAECRARSYSSHPAGADIPMMTSPVRRVTAWAAFAAIGLGPLLAPADARAAVPTLPLKGPRSGGLASARSEVRALEGALARTRRSQASARERVAALAAQALALAARLNELSARERELARQLEAARDRLRKLAVASYLSGGSSASVEYLLRARGPADLSRRRKLLTSVARIRNHAVKEFAAARRAASDQLERSIAELDHLNSQGAAARAELESASAAIGRLEARLGVARAHLKLELAVTPVGSTNIPGLFLDAYRAAAATMAKRRPGCRLRWTALAGVGRIESDHGRWGAAELSLGGDITPPIIGIPLDGNNGTALIRDTDGGALDGDPLVDHAVGPMQVIPSTWRIVAEDGNDDGIDSPNNIFDAALTAAGYLCRAAPNGLNDDAGLRAAFFSYNHSDAYSEAALGWSKVYDGERVPAGPVVPAD
jgi:membrane-bound lytic murein transglycosylase B